MDDSERDQSDEAIVSARIAGVSLRELARRHQCSTSEIENAIDRRLDYELDQRQRLRLVKLSVERILSLMRPFFDMAVKDTGVEPSTRISAAMLCCKLEERLSLLLGTDHPVQSRIDVYQVSADQQPANSWEKLHSMILRIGRQKDDNGAGDGAVGVLSDSDDGEPSH